MLPFPPSRQQRGAGPKGLAPGHFASERPSVCSPAPAYTDGGGPPPPGDPTVYRAF